MSNVNSLQSFLHNRLMGHINILQIYLHLFFNFQPLMLNEDSPIIDFYPVNFQTDLNDKQQEWEAVVLIPFIEEVREPDQLFTFIYLY